MTLYYRLVFLLLIIEMIIFLLLIVPLPFTWRKRIFRFISESALVAKLQYGMKITFIFILVLFADSVNRVYRVSLELHSSPIGLPPGSTAPFDRKEVQARMFYSQRNMYLCGFTLFLSLILNRTYALTLDVLRLEETVKQLKKEGPSSDEVNRLREQLEKAKMDKEVLKKQAEGLTREYGELSDKLIAAESSGKKIEPKKNI